jgi:hypothetical protein
MLSHCANSDCSKPFLKLREGKLFLVETIAVTAPAVLNARTDVPQRKPPKRVEHFWLCDDCAPSWTLMIQGGNRGLALVPIVSQVGGRKGTSAQTYRDVI